MNWRPVIILTLVVVPFIVMLSYGFGRNPHEVPSIMPGKAAPECTLTTTDGKQVTLSDYRGKPLLLNFWSTWCVPCEAEHGLLQQWARRFSETVTFIGVVYQDTAANTVKYLARKGSEYDQLLDSNSVCAIQYGVAGVPETFFIDAGGIIRHKEVGPVTPGLMSQAIRGLTQGAAK